MPSMNVEVSHSMGKEAAMERLKSLMEKIQNRYKDQVKDIQQSWDGDTLNYSFKTFGLTISGSMLVEEDKVTVDGKIPIAAMAFRGQIENSIRDELQKQLS
ncbi:MAG: polyhydroxyalkanoic acid system family protein [Pirellulaceae bacterium]